MTANLRSATHAVLRIAAGILFMQHGLQKLFGLLGGAGPAGGAVPLATLMGVAGILELVGGVLLILGLLTRTTAVVLIVEMAAAYVIAHLPRGGWPIQNGGELALLYAAIFIFLAGNGAGSISLDAMRTVRHFSDRRQHDLPDRRHPAAA